MKLFGIWLRPKRWQPTARQKIAYSAVRMMLDRLSSQGRLPPLREVKLIESSPSHVTILADFTCARSRSWAISMDGFPDTFTAAELERVLLS